MTTPQESENKLLADIAKNDNAKSTFFVLYDNEKSICLCENKDHDLENCKNKFLIDWLGWAAKLYRKSHSTNTITSYARGVCALRAMLIAREKSLSATVAELKQDNLQVYKLLDSFVTYCDSQRGFMPKTTQSFFNAVVQFFEFIEIPLDEKKVENISESLPQAHSIKDEYPPNDTILKILNMSPPRLRGYLQVMIDTGFEPVDTAQLKPKYFHFDEDPVRVEIDREKTSQAIETFISRTTADVVKQLIALEKIEPDQYIFLLKPEFSDTQLKNLRGMYNVALARAGFGKLIKGNRKYYAQVEKIDGHKFGKYHLKVYKKRWFSLAIGAGVPEYIAQAMLGKQYLDQYLRQPLEKKQEYARKILKAVSVYASEQDKQEIIDKVSEVVGFKVDPKTMAFLKDLAVKYEKLPNDKAEIIGKILRGDKDE